MALGNYLTEIMNKEKIVQEQRTIEAMKHGYMGFEGKFSVIARKLGYSVVSQSGSNFEQTLFEDFYGWSEEDSLPVMDEDATATEIGCAYEAYHRGMNLSVVVKYSNTEICVTYEGRQVYKEVAGELVGYVPGKEWEQCIEVLYADSLLAEKRNKPKANEELKRKAEAKRGEILQRLKERWGI